MKKLINVTLIVIILFNFIFCSTSQASLVDFDSFTSNGELNTGTQGDIVDGDGDSKLKEYMNYKSGIGAVVIGSIGQLFSTVGLIIDVCMSSMTCSSVTRTGYANALAKALDGSTDFWFTIDRCVFGQIALFNNNYFAYTESGDTYVIGGDIASSTIKADKNNIAIKKSVAVVFQFTRVLALVIGMCVLVYIGIRMAISTVASDQAKYKQMLISWVESILIIFLLPYIMALAFAVEEILMNIIYEFRMGVENDLYNNKHILLQFEYSLIIKERTAIFASSGYQAALNCIIFLIFLGSQMRFFTAYIRRFLMTGFLVAIAPLITITYSIDKVGDGKAQAFTKWMKEFMVAVFIQPIHAILYLVFIYSASCICLDHPLVGVLLLNAMGTAEKLIKMIFNMDGAFGAKGIAKKDKKKK